MRSLSEVFDRSRQYTMQLLEQISLLDHKIELDDPSLLLRHLESNLGNMGPQELLEYFVEREISPATLSYNKLVESARIAHSCYPNLVSGTIKRALEITRNQITLFGHYQYTFPKNLPDWHFDPDTGHTHPLIHWSRIKLINSKTQGNKKFVWELNRHQYFLVLGQAYLLTRDEKFANVFLEHLADWIENNPPKIGVNWASSLEIAFRSISWIWAIAYFRDCLAKNHALFRKMLNALFINGLHIERYLSTYHSPNTHLTGEALGLCYLGHFFSDSEKGSSWLAKGTDILNKALSFQVLDDGGYCEQSTHYHRYTTDFYTDFILMHQRRDSSVNDSIRLKVERLHEFIMYTTQPDGLTPLIGDDDGGQLFDFDFRPVADFRPTLSVGAVLFGRPDMKHVAQTLSARILWLLGPDGVEAFERLENRVPSARTVFFESSGYSVTRSDWGPDGRFLLVDCGYHGFLKGGHAHADALSFVYSEGIDPIFVESGTFTYSVDDDCRDLLRSPEAHNTAVIEGYPFAIPDGPFSWKHFSNPYLVNYHATDDGIYICGTIDAVSPESAAYERSVSFQHAGLLIISDVLTRKGSFKFAQHFILSPQLHAKIDNNRILIFRKNEPGRILGTLEAEIANTDGNATGDWQLERFSVSPGFAQLVPSTRLSFKGRCENHVRIVATYCSVKD